MKFIIAKNPINLLNSQGSLVLLRVPSVARNFLHILSLKWTCGSKHLMFSFSSLRAWCASSSSSSNMYGGWDDLGSSGSKHLRFSFSSLRAWCASSSSSSNMYGGWDDLDSSDASGESHALRNFLVSVGIDDRKNAFVFLLGLVCAMAISMVKVSSIVVLPAFALVFTVGFMVGFFRNGAFDEVRASGSKRREKEDNSNSKLSSEKLRSLVEFFNELDLVVNNLKSDVQSAIRNNKIRVDDFYGYVVVTDKIKISVKNARNVARSLIDNEENSGGVLVENHKSGRRKKQVGEVHGKECGFGAYDFPASGVFEVEPRKCPGFIHRCSITLGQTNMSASEFRTFIENMASEYHGDTYHLITKNCNHFTEDLSYRLTGKQISGWVNRLAKLGKTVLGNSL